MPDNKAYDWFGGSVRSGWKIVRLGSVFRERNEPTTAEDLAPLSVTKNGVVEQQESVAISGVGAPKKVARKGDFVINSRSDRKGSAGIASRDGSVSLINIVLEPKGIYPQFAKYLLTSVGFQEEFYRFGSGIVADLWTTRYSAMKTIQIPLPPLNEQIRIADELDRELAEIDEFIADLEATQLLLNEKYQLELNNLYWGEANELVPLKRFVKFVDQGSSPIADSNPAEANEIGILKAGCTAGGEFNIQANKKVIPGTPIKESTFVKEGDLLVTRASGSKKIVGSAAIVGNLDRQLALSDKIYRFQTDSPEISQYLCKVMATKKFREKLELEISGAEGLARNISSNSLFKIKIPNLQHNEIKFKNKISLSTTASHLENISEIRLLIELVNEKKHQLTISHLMRAK